MYIDDAPIRTKSDDRLHRNDFVLQLAKTISAWKSDRSLVIGLFGPWGSGKSSVLNLLEEKILAQSTDQNNGNPLVMQFDPWFFNSADELIKSFFESVTLIIGEAIQDEDTKTKLRSLLKTYTDMLSFNKISIEPKISLFGGLLSFGAKVGSKSDNLEDIRELRNEINKVLSEGSIRVIALIDNLDRLEPRELLLMLKLVRLCSDFPYFIYLLAFDYSQVVNVLHNHLDISPDYLSKIIQVDINLPQFDQSLIDRFVGDLVSEIASKNQISFENNISERFGPVYQSSMSGLLIKDLRTAKRYLNSIAFSMPLVRNEVNFADLYVLEGMKVFFSRIYREIPKYKVELTSFDTMVVGDWRKRERFIAFKAFVDWIENEIQNHPVAGMETHVAIESVCNMLSMLFPTFSAYISNPQNPTYIIGNEQAANYERSQRVCSLSHFDRYFRLRVPSEEISTTFVKELINTLNSSDEGDISDLLKILIEYQRRGLFVLLLRKLSLYAETLDPSGKDILIDLILLFSPNLDWKAQKDWLSEAQISLLLIIENLLDKDDISLLDQKLIQIVERSQSLTFAAAILEISYPNVEASKVPSSINFGQILNAFRTRLYEEIVNLNANLFILYPGSYNRILKVWRSPDFLNEEEQALNYIYNFFGESPLLVPSFLSQFVWTDLGTSTPSRFDYAKLERDYDPDILYDLLEDNGIDSSNDCLEDFSVKEFLNLYRSKSSTEA